jgi:predicted dinucleotide-binding enzyme
LASAQATPPVFLAGHDPLAKAKVARLAEDAGFAALDTGPLVAARSIEQLGVVLHHVGENRFGGDLSRLAPAILVASEMRRTTPST